jgi:hypothetical protein
MITHRIGTRHDWIRLEPLSIRDWLIIDTGQEALIGDGVIGHVQLLGGQYETLRTTDPLERTFFGTLDDAIESFVPVGMRMAAFESRSLTRAVA